MSSAAETSPSRGAVRWTRWRRSAQVSVATFFLVLPLTNRLGQDEVLGTLASLKLGPVDLVDPAVGVSAVLASGELRPTIALGMLLPALAALVLGPVFCSWACPWGLLSEMVDRGRSGRGRPSPWRHLARLRWAVLSGVLLLSLALSTPLASTLSAPRAMTVWPLELAFAGAVSLGTLTLLGALLAIELFLPRRIWCRALCPVGSILVLLRTPWTLRVRWSRASCTPERDGPRCAADCSWNLDPRHLGAFSGCTNCLTCVEGCPSSARSLNPRFGFRTD